MYKIQYIKLLIDQDGEFYDADENLISLDTLGNKGWEMITAISIQDSTQDNIQDSTHRTYNKTYNRTYKHIVYFKRVTTEEIFTL